MPGRAASSLPFPGNPRQLFPSSPAAAGPARAAAPCGLQRGCPRPHIPADCRPGCGCSCEGGPRPPHCLLPQGRGQALHCSISESCQLELSSTLGTGAAFASQALCEDPGINAATAYGEGGASGVQPASTRYCTTMQAGKGTSGDIHVQGDTSLQCPVQDWGQSAAEGPQAAGRSQDPCREHVYEQHF